MSRSSGLCGNTRIECAWLTANAAGVLVGLDALDPPPHPARTTAAPRIKTSEKRMKSPSSGGDDDRAVHVGMQGAGIRVGSRLRCLPLPTPPGADRTGIERSVVGGHVMRIGIRIGPGDRLAHADANRIGDVQGVRMAALRCDYRH